MTPVRRLAAATAVVVAATLVDSPGHLLTTGMQLAYSNAGQEGPPWSIVSVSGDTAFGGMSQCRVIVLRMDPTRPAETRAWCARGDTLFAWDTLARVHRPLRPLGARMSLDVRGRTGSVSTYVTGEPAVETISGVRLDVIPTTVTTRDSSGRVLRRLRERYAHGLATATGGVFEVPDSSQAGGWRTQVAFDLVRITR